MGHLRINMLIISLILNVLLFIFTVIFAYKADYFTKNIWVKSETIEDVQEDANIEIESAFSNDEYSYLDNPSYLARSSMFEKTLVTEADIVFAGDSLTQFGNWNELLACDAINRGIGSDTAEGLYNRIEQIIQLNPNIVFIMIGINDVGHNIPKNETVKYVEKICNTISDSGAEVYLFSILPTCFDDAEQTSKIQELNNDYRKIANDNRAVVFIDLYPLYFNEDGTVNQSLYSADGVHLNGDGYLMWINQISNLIDKN